jgi:uncharacterized protein (DUF2267 family)/CBS domain-containing protein
MYEFLEYRVGDVMTYRPVTVSPQVTLAEVEALFEKHQFNCFPVTQDGALVGVVTKLDFLKAFAFTPRTMIPPYEEIMRQPVSAVMTLDPVSVTPETRLTRTLQTMAETRYRSLPVAIGALLVGIVAREDIQRGLRRAVAGERPRRPEPRPVAETRPIRCTTEDRAFIRQVADALRADDQRTEGVVFAVFQVLRDRLPPKEAADVASQLPTNLKRLWLEQERPDRDVVKMHEQEFLGRVRQWAGLPDDAEAERAVRAVFAALQRLLGSPTGREGEAWDVFSVLPKDLKMLWLAAPRAESINSDA